MLINLNKLTEELNKKFGGNDRNFIIIELCEDGRLRISKGDVAYFCDYKIIEKMLDVNSVDLKNETLIYDVLSKYITNQLLASRGRKNYPEIFSINGDK